MRNQDTQSPTRPSVRTLVVVAVLLYIADQVSKWIARTNIEVGDYIPFIDGFWYWNHLHNKGIAWGMFGEAGWANLVFGLVAVTAMIGIVFLWRRGAFPGPLSRTAAALLISGILGNLTDRLLRGHVTDFLLFDLKFWTQDTYWFPSFNIADSCICVAAGFLILASFIEDDGSEEATEKEK